MREVYTGSLIAMNWSKELLLNIYGILRCSKSWRTTHLPEIIVLLERRIYRFSARSETNGCLVLVDEEEGTTDFPFSVLDLLGMIKF